MNIFYRKKIFLFTAYSIFLFGYVFCAHAQEFTSPHFEVSDPVMTGGGGGYANSTDYQIQSSIGQMIIGTSTSVDFGTQSGFEYFPFVSSPVVIATGGTTQVSLSWTSASAGLGWNVGGYRVGMSTNSGGPYAFTSVGNVTGAIIPALTNNTTYYFVVQALDVFGNVIVTSGEVSATTNTGTPTTCTDHAATNYGGSLPCVYPPSGGGGGGGGGGGPVVVTTPTGVNFSGRAYPLSKVNILEDGQLVVTTIADPDANFSVTLSGLATGNYTFSVYGEDDQGRRSSNFTFPIYITQGVVTNIGGIFLAPTIATDKSEVKRGDNLVIFGQSVPSAMVTIAIHSNQEIFSTTTADKNGAYLYNLDTTPLEIDTHSAQSKAALNGNISVFSNSVSFRVGTENVIASSTRGVCGRGDLNCDGKVDLVDFSIAAYWYKKPLNATMKQIEKDRLNGDGVINLVDFSIMAYYWTG
jgi:hypothetical protein